jgi:hypothetical protein
MSIANLIRRAGRGMLIISRPPRKVHAKRARKLRRMGRGVKFTGWTETGKAVYTWDPVEARRPVQMVSREKSLFQQMADLERAWSEHLGEPPEEIPSLAQQRTRTYQTTGTFIATTPNGSETPQQWAERMMKLQGSGDQRREFVHHHLGQPYQADAMKKLGEQPAGEAE